MAEKGRDWGWGSPAALACYVVGVLGFAAFCLIEQRMGAAALIPFRLFRSGTFTVASVMSFILGIGMFGGIVTIPLYFQLVKGASPTESGLLMLPLVVGIMSASLGAGQFTSRTGRYKIMPIIGTGAMVVGLVLLNRVSADSSLAVVDVFMFIFGAGLGLCMQTVVLAMQNSVPASDIGVATSSATFFRQVGGTMGTAVFLSILFSSVGTKVKAAYTDAFAGKDPDFTAATHNPAVTGSGDNAKFLSSLRNPSGSGGIDLNDTSFLNGLNHAIAHPFEVGFSQAMDLVFLCAAAIIVVALRGVVLPQGGPAAHAGRQPGCGQRGGSRRRRPRPRRTDLRRGRQSARPADIRSASLDTNQGTAASCSGFISTLRRMVTRSESMSMPGCRRAKSADGDAQGGDEHRIRAGHPGVQHPLRSSR